ncbi:hypothetical protein JCM16163A_34580 [Paenibacillus sp. YK5]|uniref:Uncharacterized protein n=1 Tax=Paenibacillus naphthalenovorans TaxID=162209 RepID=A0A0U2IMN7_9BACL|nr:hypothetical protein IJ22_26780 [Paenibacillus naphthalenovorans]GCL71888.1 hypothetical protein PN4B1_17930 [Paenibacillus naphthalenovorans]SDI41681.1 hypothetical protein SAMN05421868_10670 [Paenibacillus naphthalenovorans]
MKFALKPIKEQGGDEAEAKCKIFPDVIDCRSTYCYDSINKLV